ncbi:hypothetical protein ABIE54_005805 [Chitinophagaceae bacterium OAS944]
MKRESLTHQTSKSAIGNRESAIVLETQNLTIVKHNSKLINPTTITQPAEQKSSINAITFINFSTYYSPLSQFNIQS